MKNMFKEIVKFLQNNSIKYELLTHEMVFTSEEASRVRGLNMKQGAKSLLLKTDSDFLLAILPGDTKLDTKKLKKILNAKNIRFANPEEVEEKMFCKVGACYPFGNLLGIQMLVDNKLAENEVISFNPSLHNKSIKIKWEDYKRAVNPQLVDISYNG